MLYTCKFILDILNNSSDDFKRVSSAFEFAEKVYDNGFELYIKNKGVPSQENAGTIFVVDVLKELKELTKATLDKNPNNEGLIKKIKNIDCAIEVCKTPLEILLAQKSQDCSKEHSPAA